MEKVVYENELFNILLYHELNVKETATILLTENLKLLKKDLEGKDLEKVSSKVAVNLSLLGFLIKLCAVNGVRLTNLNRVDLTMHTDDLAPILERITSGDTSSGALRGAQRAVKNMQMETSDMCPVLPGFVLNVVYCYRAGLESLGGIMYLLYLEMLKNDQSL